MATLAQLAAARRLTGESVLIRNAHSVEALARLDVVCFDKTGTLEREPAAGQAVRPRDGVHRRTRCSTRRWPRLFARHSHRVDHATDDAIRSR